MNPQQTPIKKKLNQFHNLIRSQQLSHMKSTVRTINAQNSRKKLQKDKFKQVCGKLDVDCGDIEALQELKRMYNQEAFVINEKHCVYLMPIVKEILKRSQIEKESQEKRQTIIKYTKQLYELLHLLTRNACRYPKYGCYDDPMILQQVIAILRLTSDQNVRNQALRFVNFLILNAKARKYLLQHHFLIILAQDRFSISTRLIEQLFANLFETGMNVSVQNIEQLILLFNSHENKLFSVLNGDIIEQLYHFMRCLCEQGREGLKKQSKFVELVNILMKRMQGIDIEEMISRRFYVKMIRFCVGVLECAECITERNKTIMLHHMRNMWKIHEEVFPIYQILANQLNQNLTEQQTNGLQPFLKQHQEKILSFCLLFQLCMNNNTLSTQQSILEYKDKYFPRFYKIFQQQGYMTAEQLRILLQHGPMVEQQHYPQLINWYYKTIENTKTRVACLKILSQEVIRGKITYKDYQKLAEFYQTMRQNFDQKYHPLTDYILNQRHIPTLEEIEKKQYEIQFRNEERLRMEEEDNMDEEVSDQ